MGFLNFILMGGGRVPIYIPQSGSVPVLVLNKVVY